MYICMYNAYILQAPLAYLIAFSTEPNPSILRTKRKARPLCLPGEFWINQGNATKFHQTDFLLLLLLFKEVSSDSTRARTPLIHGKTRGEMPVLLSMERLLVLRFKIPNQRSKDVEFRRTGSRKQVGVCERTNRSHYSSSVAITSIEEAQKQIDVDRAAFIFLTLNGNARFETHTYL